MPTAIWNSPLRSGSAHWDLEFAVEVRQCPLRSGSRGWDLDCEEEEADCDLEVAVGIWTARRRRRRRWRRRMRRRRRRTALIKSNNPHLAGGEKTNIHEDGHVGRTSSIYLAHFSSSFGQLPESVPDHLLPAALRAAGAPAAFA